MPSTTPRILLRLTYSEAAQEYFESLPEEHFMEATAQATQREITLESLALVRARRPDIQVFTNFSCSIRCRALTSRDKSCPTI